MNQPDVTSKDRFLSSRQRYQEIVNKASCLSLVSNAILYLENTIKIAETVGRLRAQGEDISDETLSHVLCCRSGMSYRMARTFSRIAKLGEKAVAHSNCAQNRNILFKCPRWSHVVAA